MNQYPNPNQGPGPYPNQIPFSDAPTSPYQNQSSFSDAPTNPFPNANLDAGMNPDQGTNYYPYPGPGMNPKPAPDARTNKKLLIIVGVLAIVLLGLVVAAIAVVSQHATPGTATASNATPTVPVSTGVANTAKAKTRRVVGVIQSINAQSILILPQNKKKPVAVLLTNVTKYRTASAKASMSDLKVGETVAVIETYDAQSGVWNATRITISPNLATPTAILRSFHPSKPLTGQAFISILTRNRLRDRLQHISTRWESLEVSYRDGVGKYDREVDDSGYCSFGGRVEGHRLSRLEPEAGC